MMLSKSSALSEYGLSFDLIDISVKIDLIAEKLRDKSFSKFYHANDYITKHYYILFFKFVIKNLVFQKNLISIVGAECQRLQSNCKNYEDAKSPASL